MTTASSRQALAQARKWLGLNDDRYATRSRGTRGGVVRESVTLPRHARSAGDARRVTGRMCTDAALTEDVRDRAVLATSEVITNAILHGKGATRLTVTTRPGGVKIEVGDASRRLPARRPGSQPLAGGGIQVLGSCANLWGVRKTARGKVVWVDVVDRPVGAPGRQTSDEPGDNLDSRESWAFAPVTDQDPIASMHDTTEEVGDEAGLTDIYLMDLREAEELGVALDPSETVRPNLR